MKYKGIIFDLDGTLLDSLLDLANSVNYALEMLGFEKRSLKEVRGFVGNGVEMLVKRALPQGYSEAEFTKCRALQREFYNEHKMDNTCVYAGMLELLESIKGEGACTAIVSNKYDLAVKDLSQNMFGGLIDIAMGTSESINKKPMPDGLNLTIEKLGLENNEVIYIGDSEVDVETAKNAEVDMIGVSWGFRDRRVLEDMGVLNIADSVEELRKMLL